MIGGSDHIFPTGLRAASAREAAVRAVARRWRNAIFQSGTTGQTFERFALLPVEASPEILIYRDIEAFTNWNEQGADNSNCNTMIHVLAYEAGRITVVVDDDADDQMRELLEEIASFVADDGDGTPPPEPYFASVFLKAVA